MIASPAAVAVGTESLGAVHRETSMVDDGGASEMRSA